MKRTIIFCFGGRRPNLELQLPFIRRILEDRPDVEYHLWNLAKDPGDDAYIRNLANGFKMPRGQFKVRNDFAGKNPWEHFDDVYRSYTHPFFKKFRFVKLDDDDVFIQTKELGTFLDAIDQNPHAVVSANVINNGACMRADSALYGRYRSMGIPLLDVHKHPRFAQMSHEYFFDNWRTIVEREPQWVATSEWLSINCIGYDYEMGRTFASLLGTPHPRVVAGRRFRPVDKLGDEGMVNTLPRLIVKGFTVAHLTFGPQEKKAPHIWSDLRKRYAEIGQEYLNGL